MATIIETLQNGTTSVRTMDSDGNEWVAGKITVAALTPTAAGDLASKDYVDEQISSSGGSSITITPATAVGSKICDIDIDGVTTTLYSPNPPVATTATAGLMSAQDKQDLDRLKISGSTPITLSGEDSIEVPDAANDSVQAFFIDLEPDITVVPGKNLANPDTNIEGYYIGANGKPTASPNDWYTALIPVSAGERVYVSGYHTQTDNGNKRLHGYDANGNWVQQLGYTAVAAGSAPPAFAYSFNVTIPNNSVRYMRFSYRIADTEVMVQKETNSPYEPYGEQYEFSQYVGPLTITKTASTTSTYNIQIPSMYGGTVDAVNGEVQQTWGYISSYDGETLPGQWWSTYAKSSSAASPSSGEEVMYELATPQVSAVTPVLLTTDEDYNKFEINMGSIETFTYGAKGSIISNLNITSGVVTLGQTSLNEQQLAQLLQLLN